MKKSNIYKLWALLFFWAFLSESKAQNKDALTESDYENAARFLSQGMTGKVYNSFLNVHWMKDDTFWYLDESAENKTFYLVNPKKKIKKEAFDHQKLTVALNKATGKVYPSHQLPFNFIKFSEDQKSISFNLDKQSWKYQISKNTLEKSGETLEAPQRSNPMMRFMGRGAGATSPDGKLSAFIKDYNLWVKNIETEEETQLTIDGIEDFGYATDNAGWRTGTGAIVKWSPDSKKITTYQQDQRHVKNMYLVTTNVGAPKLQSWKYPLPGDKEIIMIHRIVIDVPSKTVTRLKMDPDPRRSTISDDIRDGMELADISWAEDGSKFMFLSVARDHKEVKLRLANAETGEVKEIFKESSPTYIETGVNSSNWRYLEKTNEIIWYSERDNWGHLYLYDANTGQLKNQITKGDFVVGRIMDLDEKSKEITFNAYGLDPKNPYYEKICRVNFDGNNFTELTPATGTHSISWSESKNYFIDTYSEPDVPQTHDLRDKNGTLIFNLGKADISEILATGWTPPTPVKLLAADGKTDIYGLVYTPTNMDRTQKYPIIDYIYPGPQGGSVRGWGFSTVAGDNRALAELGFIVVAIEGTSNPKRSKSYHDMNYGNMGENTLPDQITGIKQLAEQFPIDLDRVGIWGHSGGGFATAAAMFKYPDFFKVGISESGNHDNRNYEDNWGERYNGLLENSDYEDQANQTHAKNLKGKLMLAHGMMDNNVPPYNTLLVVEALQKANKDFDLVIFPSATHGFGQYSNYMMRLRWDYFVKHLKGIEPPKEFDFNAFLRR